MLSKLTFQLNAIGASIFGIFVCLKTYYGPQRYKGMERLAGKTVIVTGASSGIGADVAKDLAARGARVIMACPNLEKCEDHMHRVIGHTHNRQVFCRKLDLASQESIRQFAADIVREEKKVDLLVNNAAVMNLPTRELTSEYIERQFGINFLGHFLLTHLLLDRLKAAEESRVVLIVCEEYAKGDINFGDVNSEKFYDPNASYAKSQLAKVIYGQELARNLASSNVSVFMVDPGITNSNLRRYMSYNNNIVSRGILELVNMIVMRPVWQSIGGVLHVCISPELSNSHSGRMFRDFKEVTPAHNTTDPLLAKRLWNLGLRWSRLLEVHKNDN